MGRIGKKTSLLYYLLVLSLSMSCAHRVAADHAETIKHFNYYERSYFGSFLLDTIENAPTQGIELLQYEAHYKNDNLQSIIGYYHGSEQVKFIDSIENQRITRTQYFDPDGAIIQDKRLVWDGNRLIEIDISKKTIKSGNTIKILQRFSYVDSDRIEYEAEKTFVSKSQIRKLVSTGYFNTRLQPVYRTSVLSISIADEDAKVNETYTYNAQGLLTEYRAEVEGYGETQRFEYFYDNAALIKMVEIANFGEFRRETIYKDGHEIEYNNISGNEMKLYMDVRCIYIRKKLKFCEWYSKYSSTRDGLVNRAVEFQDQRVQQIATGSGSYSTSKTLILNYSFEPSIDAFPYRYMERIQ